MLTVILLYPILAVAHGIAYFSICGLAPAWYMITRLSVHSEGTLEESPWFWTGAFFAVWGISFALLSFPGGIGGIFIIPYAIMYFLSLHQQFIMTVIGTIIVGTIYEIFNGRIQI